MTTEINKYANLKIKSFIKKKINGLSKTGGRNTSGKITVRHKGGGHKRKYRRIDFYRTKNSISVVYAIEYDPNRNARIASVFDPLSKSFFYILAPRGLNAGDIIKSGFNIEPKLGFSLPLYTIPVGSYIYNVSLKEYSAGQVSRSAGTFSIIKEKTLNFVRIKLSSGEQKLISPNCFASIGVVSNEMSQFSKLKKAGQARWLNKRPTVRGVAMNPVDHPHGGGEGKKSGKGKTLWGMPVKRGKTRKSKNNESS